MKLMISLILACFTIAAYAEDLPILQTNKVFPPYFDENVNNTSANIRGGILSSRRHQFRTYAQHYEAGVEKFLFYDFNPFTPIELHFNIQPVPKDIGKVAEVVITATYITIEDSIKTTLEYFKKGQPASAMQSDVLATRELSSAMGYVVTPTALIPTSNKVNESLYPEKFIPFTTITLKPEQDILVYQGDLAHVSGVLTFMCYYKIQGEDGVTFTREPIGISLVDPLDVTEVFLKQLESMNNIIDVMNVLNMLSMNNSDVAELFSFDNLGFSNDELESVGIPGLGNLF